MDLAEYLETISDDSREIPEVRKLATNLLRAWDAGIVPSPKKIAHLRKLLRRPNVCAKLQPDGSCAWLRRNARMVGLLEPGPGEKAYCHRKLTGVDVELYEACPGYRKVKESDEGI